MPEPDEATGARKQDEFIEVLARLTSVTPALRAADGLDGIIAALNQAARELDALLQDKAVN